MNDDDVEQQLIRAETHLARTLQRLSALRRAALYGTFDVRAFDEAVIAYRAAEGDVLEIRKAWARRKQQLDAGATGARGPQGGGAAPVADEEIEPLEPTPRLLFARWLVQTGRLSDWNTADDQAMDLGGAVTRGWAAKRAA